MFIRPPFLTCVYSFILWLFACLFVSLCLLLGFLVPFFLLFLICLFVCSFLLSLVCSFLPFFLNFSLSFFSPSFSSFCLFSFLAYSFVLLVISRILSCMHVFSQSYSLVYFRIPAYSLLSSLSLSDPYRTFLSNLPNCWSSFFSASITSSPSLYIFLVYFPPLSKLKISSITLFLFLHHPSQLCKMWKLWRRWTATWLLIHETDVQFLVKWAKDVFAVRVSLSLLLLLNPLIHQPSRSSWQTTSGLMASSFSQTKLQIITWQCSSPAVSSGM